MNTLFRSGSKFRYSLGPLLVLALSTPAITVCGFSSLHETILVQGRAEALTPAEFSRLIQELSEEDGYFRSDNFISNETSYLQVGGQLEALSVSGGAYIGVGPEQNFTYIAKLRPEIAFIVDIRRQAIIQHLLFKSLFHLSENPAEFLAKLLSRPLSAEAPGPGASIDRLLGYFDSVAGSQEIFAANLEEVRQFIQKEMLFPLSPRDQGALEYVYSTFYREGLDISFRMSGPTWRGGAWRFPDLRRLILQRDQKGELGHFLAVEEDYRVVRDLHLRNRIIPIVGDFGGPRALAAVGDYLREEGYTVRAYYTSNVEQYLFRSGSFPAFVENIRKLPIDSDTVFIRALTRSQFHPAHIPGHRSTTVLQKVSAFLDEYDAGGYVDYWELVRAPFIVAQ